MKKRAKGKASKRKPEAKVAHKNPSALLEAHLAAIQASREREREAFRKMVESLRGAPPKERAEGLLRYWANPGLDWGDQEAVVYLVSRAHDCTTVIRSIQEMWREAEKSSIQRLIGEQPNSPYARQVRENPSGHISHFWNFYDHQEFSIDATMLRTAEWCKIRGYDQWWKSLENHFKAAAFSGGVSLFTLFNYCRADRAIREMVATLRLLSNAAVTLSSRSTPWWRHDGNLECATYDAAAIAFAYLRTNADDESQVVERAIDDLRKSFDHDRGAWPAFSGEPERLSIELTAMALHALRVANVDDFSQFANPAVSWLWSQQHVDGYWFENAAPDPVWLTVLTLDAIAMAKGENRVTFDFQNATARSPIVFVAYQHSDTEILQQLSDHLGHLRHGGDIEFYSDREIGAGEEWDPAIKEKMQRAKIIVLLISPKFLGSKYIQAVELPTAISRHRKGEVTVVPVLIEHCDWEGLQSKGFSLSRISFLPKDKNRDLKPLSEWKAKKHEALAQVAQAIRHLAEKCHA